MDHVQMKAALDKYQTDKLKAAPADSDPNWLQTVGYVGQALNILGVTGVTVNRDVPNQNQSEPEQQQSESGMGVSPVLLIVGGVLIIGVLVLVLNKD